MIKVRHLSPTSKSYSGRASFWRRQYLLLLAVCPLIASAQNSYQPNFQALEIDIDRRLNDRLYHEDMNGDGLVDMLVTRYDSALGRELHIYHQRDNGSFEQNPQRIEIKTEIVAFGFADLRPEPGSEIVLFANSAVFSLSTGQEGYAGNLKLLTQWELIASTPDLKTTRYIAIEDINKDGHADLLLPGADGYGLFLGSGNEEFELQAVYDTRGSEALLNATGDGGRGFSASAQITAEEGIVFDLSREQITAFTGFVEAWRPDTNEEPLMDTESWIPTARLADMNADLKPDLVYLNVGEDMLARLNVHLQTDDGSFPQSASWQAQVENSGDVSLVDLNADGYTDVLRVDNRGNEANAFFYANREGRIDFSSTTQVMRFAGYGTELRLVDIDGSGKPELTVNYYTIPVVDAIRSASILRSKLIFEAAEEPELLFKRRPSASLEQSFSANEVRSLTEQLSLQYDIDGDGVNEALEISENGSIQARRISKDLSVESAVVWQYVPTRTVTGFQVLDLNTDDTADIILYHASAATVLVSTP